MNEFVNEFGSLILDDPYIIEENIAIIPILQEENEQFKERNYITAEEAEDQLIFQDTGDINRVRIINNSGQKVLVVGGTLVQSEGQQTQDRVILKTVLIQPNEKLEIPCRCVHASQPISRGSGFKYSYRAPARMSKGMIMSDTMGVNQNRIWNEVRETEGALKRSRILSENHNSDRLSDILTNSRIIIETITNKIEPKDNQRGILIINGNEVVGIELVDNPITYKHIHSKILNSFIEVLINKSKEKLDIERAVKKKIKEIKNSNITRDKKRIIKENRDLKCEILEKEESDDRIIYRCY